jgi:hypothetical protein
MLRRNTTKVRFVLVTLALLFAFQPYQAKGQNPWGILSGFHSVGVSRIDDSAVVAVLFNSDEKLLAMVVFPAVCEGENCTLSDPGAFIITDLEGGVVRLHIEPGREAICHPIFASVVKGFSVA